MTITVLSSNKADVKKLQEAYAKLKKSKRGRAICKILEDSKAMYYIRPKKNEWIYYSEVAAKSGNEACSSGGNTVYMDPNNGPTIPEATGLEPPALEIVLGHELGHATGTHDDGPGKMNNVNLNENPLRAELGYPLRTEYDDRYGFPSTIGPYRKKK